MLKKRAEMSEGKKVDAKTEVMHVKSNHNGRIKPHRAHMKRILYLYEERVK